MQCGESRMLSTDLRAAEFLVTVNISQLAPDASIGLYLLASPGMEESASVGINSSSVYIDTRNSTQNTTQFEDSFRTVLTAPVPAASSVVALHVYQDETVVEVFASDCVCSSAGLANCDCFSSHSKEAIVLTGLAFPTRASASRSGLLATCGASDSGATASASVWPLRAAPVSCKAPLCTPPSSTSITETEDRQ